MDCAMDINNKITLPEQSLENLRCSNCRRYLSVPPVDLVREICGRCNTDGTSTRAYEAIAQFLIFPCVWPDCDEKMCWGDAKEHELICWYRLVNCPVFDCREEYAVLMMGDHFTEFHSDMIRSFPVSLTTVLNYGLHGSREKLVYYIDEPQPYLILVYACKKLYLDEMRFSVGVFSILDAKEATLKLDINIYSHHSDDGILLKNKVGNIMHYDGSVHNFYNFEIHYNTISGEDPSIHVNWKAEEYNFLPIAFDITTKNLTRISCLINPFHNKSSKEADNKNICDQLLKDLRSKVTCPICFEYMTAPIYNCEGGHSFCNVCRKQISVCPYCNISIEKSRNFILEDISENVAFYANLTEDKDNM